MRPERPQPTAPHLPEPRTTEFGVFEDDGTLQPTVEIPLFAGSTFGWRLELGCQGEVKVREELRLPRSGDWGPDEDMTISHDGRLAVVNETLPCSNGWIEKVWSVSAGDPPGVWVIRVTAEGFAPQAFRATFAYPATH